MSENLEGSEPGTPANEYEERHRRIARAAYYRAEQRGFTPGYEEEDWLAAEREIEGGANPDFHAEDNYFPTPK